MGYICEKPAGSCPGCCHYRYDDDYGGMACFATLDKKAKPHGEKKLDQKYLDVLDNHDWQVSSYTDDGRVEIQKYSPAGEDFTICVEVEDFPRAVAEYAADFDPDEHIEMWIEAKNNGVKGVPGTRELVHDAEDIDKMLQELASALMEADEATNFSDCDEVTKATILANAERLAERDKAMDKSEFRQWIYENYNVPGDNCTLAPAMLDGILDYAEEMNREQRFIFFITVFPSIPTNIIHRVEY